MPSFGCVEPDLVLPLLVVDLRRRPAAAVHRDPQAVPVLRGLAEGLLQHLHLLAGRLHHPDLDRPVLRRRPSRASSAFRSFRASFLRVANIEVRDSVHRILREPRLPAPTDAAPPAGAASQSLPTASGERPRCFAGASCSSLQTKSRVTSSVGLQLPPPAFSPSVAHAQPELRPRRHLHGCHVVHVRRAGLAWSSVASTVALGHRATPASPPGASPPFWSKTRTCTGTVASAAFSAPAV